MLAWGYDYIEERKSVATPMQFDSLAGKKVVYASCGAEFTIVIIENGEVYSWGTNKYGQLGIDDPHNRKTPCRIDSLEGIVIGRACLDKAIKE